MLQDIINFLTGIDPLWIYLVLFGASFIENVFPPSPSDLIVVFGTSLISDGMTKFIPILVITSIGSSLGFILMYYVGKIFGERILRKGKIKFISQEAVNNTEAWFNKYGYKLITANRFLPGSRSIISFFSGVSELNVFKTFIYSTISAFAWNAIIIYLGILLGNNLDKIDYYLSTYSNIVIFLTVLILIFFIVKKFILKKK